MQQKAFCSVNGIDQEHITRFDEKKQLVDSVCEILEGGQWGTSLENALSKYNESTQSDLMISVLRKLKDVNLAVSYFKWAESKTKQPHCLEAYNSVLMVMARSNNFFQIEQVFEEMNLAGFGPSNTTCIELIVSCIKIHKLKEAYDILELMRKFKF
ncbi:hypothetical protein QVD17_34686 [Tagetes erecta]|uniref:Pentatricopeptide repeat-containing protein n=1 Tax=Tagetes erecta TaxID=13708 RepID=A0AAD8JY43_TARER|nr:hypothetical protein QVD17_34686 [Tagetes erecta]